MPPIIPTSSVRISAPRLPLTAHNELLFANIITLEDTEKPVVKLYNQVTTLYQPDRVPIGKGCNGECRVYHRRHGDQAATDGPQIPASLVMKLPTHPGGIPATEHDVMQRLTLLGYDYFVRLYGTVFDDITRHINHIFIEHMNCASLDKHLDNFARLRPEDEDDLTLWRSTMLPESIQEDTVKSIFWYMAKAALVAATGSDSVAPDGTAPDDWPHTLVHLDLQPRNIFVNKQNKQFRYAWGDFGSCACIPTDWSSATTADLPENHDRLVPYNGWFRPPESHNADHTTLGHWTNTWGIGVVMWWVLELVPLPRHNDDDDDDGNDDFHFDPAVVGKHTRYSGDLLNLIQTCLHNDYRQRPSPSSLLQAIELLMSPELLRNLRHNSTPCNTINPDLDQTTHQAIHDARRSISDRSGNDFNLIHSIPGPLQHGAYSFSNLPEATTHYAVRLEPPAFNNPNQTRMIKYPDHLPNPDGQFVTKLTIFRRDTRGRIAPNQPKNYTTASFFTSPSATIADLKQHVHASCRRDTYTGGHWILVLHRAHTKLLPDSLEICDLKQNHATQPTPAHIRRRSTADSVELDVLIVDGAAPPPADDSEPSSDEETNQATSQLSIYHTPSLQQLPSFGYRTIPESFVQVVVLWPSIPHDQRTRHTVKDAVAIRIRITQPQATTIQDLQQAITQHCGYRLNMRDGDTVRITDSGPVQALHLGSHTPLDGSLNIANVVFSRECDPHRGLLHRHLDATIIRHSQNPNKRTKQ